MSSTSSSAALRLRDLSHPVVAGVVSVIVNYGGTFILVFQAAKVAGLGPELTASGVWSISIGVGVTGLMLSWATREPIITAWSTPAGAFLVTALAATPYEQAVGAYLVSALAFVLLGVSGCFERVIRLIPPGIAAGLLAGILLQFGIGAFGGMSVDPFLAGLLILACVIFKRYTARYAVLGILMLGLAYLVLQGRVDLAGLALLGAIGGSLALAMTDTKTREASLITFLAAAANIKMLGIGGAFWGLVIGLLAYAVLNGRLQRQVQMPRCIDRDVGRSVLISELEQRHAVVAIRRSSSAASLDSGRRTVRLFWPSTETAGSPWMVTRRTRRAWSP